MRNTFLVGRVSAKPYIRLTYIFMVINHQRGTCDCNISKDIPLGENEKTAAAAAAAAPAAVPAAPGADAAAALPLLASYSTSKLLLLRCCLPRTPQQKQGCWFDVV